RGAAGPQCVSRVRVEHPLNDAFLQAAIAAGIPFNADLNGALAEGVGPVQASQRGGWRHSTAQAYIRPARRRANLRVIHHAVAASLLFDGGRVTGVQCSVSGRVERFSAARVVLACGALATPLLMMRSGLGDPTELASHGIPVRAALHGVGHNLQEHAVARFGIRLRTDTLTSALNPLRSVAHGLEFLLKGSGALSTAIAHVHALARTRAELQQPDVQILFSPADHRLTERGAVPCREPTVSVGVGLCQSRARGRIRLRSTDPAAAPRIEHALLAHPEDLATLTAGCRLARRIVSCQPFSDFLESEIAPGSAVESDNDWADYLRDNTGLMYHPCGTARMGSDEAAVVDPRLRVRGLEGLWIADASVIPSIPAGNINATCILIGERAADFLQAEGSR
ncbi:MAG: GMC family oxidoreductase, partial [Nevskiaceae bacterium]